MKSIFVAALFAAFSHVALAADTSTTSATKAKLASAVQTDQAGKACYKEERIDPTDPAFEADGTGSGPTTSAFTRIPCTSQVKIAKK